MERQFNSTSFYAMIKVRDEIECKLSEYKGNKAMEEIYKNQLKIVQRCINTLYL